MASARAVRMYALLIIAIINCYQFTEHRPFQAIPNLLHSAGIYVLQDRIQYSQFGSS